MGPPYIYFKLLIDLRFNVYFSGENMDKALIDKYTVFSTIVGSKAYGTDVEGSDIDVRGIAILNDLSYYFGFLNRFEQYEDDKMDTVIYDIRKFFNLMANANPNCLDLLFADERFHQKVDVRFRPVLDNRNIFLSKRVRFTYVGFAYSQLKRIRSARSWLLDPPKKKPERSDFGLPDQSLLSKDDLGAFQWVLANLLKDSINYLNFSDATKEELNQANWIGLIQQKGIPENSFDKIQKMTGASDEWMNVMKGEQGYINAKRHYDAYTQWKNSRNKKRADIEEKFGYDCYVEETEFLTNNGWKYFDKIFDDDMLATVVLPDKCPKHVKPFSIEYQKPTEKFDALFNGNLYNLFGYHTDTLVSPNHKMIFRRVERKSEKIKEWEMNDISNLPDTFDVLRYPTPKTKNYCVEKYFTNISIKQSSFLKLIGWYLSDGCISFKNNIPKDIRISQIKGGKLHNSMSKFASKYNTISSLYIYDKPPNKFSSLTIKEVVLSVRDNYIVNKIFNECGYKETKKIPRWIFGLSKYQMEIVLDAIILGDGTKSRPDNSIIYYSKSKNLANDVQELALLCGFETSLYGPYKQNNQGYEIEMYHVHINKTRKQFKRCVRSANVISIPTFNKRIVCFSVPNGTLITRHNGHIGIHGNCKHAMHLVRLMRMGKEILSEGKVIVYRPDRDELKAIRDGAWKYDKVEEYAEQMEQEIASLYVSSTLPKEPNRNELDKLCIGVVQKCLDR